MVIVGAGETGGRAAIALREHGWDGPITLIGEESHPPYERPPLSKNVITSNDMPMPTVALGPERMAELTIAHLPGRRAIAIDRTSNTVRLDDGQEIAYDRLLLATGAEARRIALTGAGAENVIYLRRFEDALAIRAKTGHGTRVAVVGGGFIGLELAASVTMRGARVTLLEAAPRLLTRGVPAELAQAIADRHRSAGVDLRTGIQIARIDGDAVVLANDERVPCDVVIVGVGAVPRTELAEDAGLAIDNGVAVDSMLASDDPRIFAAGDCCSFIHPLYENRRLRLESWRSTHDQGALAARNMLGAGAAIAAVPWFWSDQYELCLQITGLADAGETLVARDLGDGAVILFHLASDGRLVAASALGPIGKVGREVRLAEMLIERRAAPDPEQLSDPAVRLKALLKG